MSPQALIVGSGPNGLAAAITMARADWDVTVLEAAPRPGGAVTSEELTLPGFVHDTCSAVYPGAVASPVFSQMPLEDHGLRWIHPQACYAHPFADGRGAALYRDVERTAASLDELAPGQGEGWTRFAAPLLDQISGLRATMLGGFPPIRGIARLAVGLRAKGLLDLARLLLMPAQALGEELFGDSRARAWLYGSALHGDVPPAGPGSAIMAIYLNLLGHAAGWPSPEGGAGRLSGALISYLQSLGATVRSGAEVMDVVARRRRVAGVRLRGGEAVAGSVVIADVMPAALARLAGELLPSRYMSALLRYRPGPATLKIDWALAGPIPWASEEARRAGTVHVGGDEQEVIDGIAAGDRLPARPFMLLGQQTIADPTRAPTGKHTAWAYAHGPQTLDWRSERNRHVDRMEAQIERFAPGFRSLILARHVIGPEDFQRRNANLVGGDVGGGSFALDQLVFRPLVSLSPYATPLRGLYLGSAAAFPGGGVHGVPGYAAARLALRHARLRRV